MRNPDSNPQADNTGYAGSGMYNQLEPPHLLEAKRSYRNPVAKIANTPTFLRNGSFNLMTVGIGIRNK